MSAIEDGGSITAMADWDDEFCFIQFRVPRSFKHRFQDWCDSQGVTMSGAIICWIADRERIGLPPAIKKPWKELPDADK